ncbi:MAG TPA: methyl-accepting chemotaxis protein [Patescibacteria group bacterium]|nr:methyl-accepting chemotaxis protein [Patescibacteria group bacterium]
MLSLGVLAGTSYFISQRSLAKSISQTAMAVGTDYTERVRGDMELMLAQLDDLANTSQVRGGTAAGREPLVAMLADVQKRLGTFDVLVYVDAAGAGVTNTGAGASYAERDYFKKVMATKNAVVSDPLISKATGKLAVVLAVPVKEQNRVNGVLVGTFSLERLSNMLASVKFLDTGYAQLADDSGMLIAHPKRAELVGKLNLTEKKINPELKLPGELDERMITLFKNTAQEGRQTQGRYTFVDGITRVAVSTPVDLPGGQRWVMTVAAPEAEVDRETDFLNRALLVVSLVCLLVAAVAIWVVARYFARPIAAMRDECLMLAQGDLSQREIRVSSADEIGQLAEGFRNMRGYLRELVSQLHSQSEQLAASSEELTASADQSAQAANQVAIAITAVASGAEAQLAAASETTAVVDQISRHIHQVVNTTRTVAEHSVQAAGKAQQGDAVVNQVVEQMTQIEKAVNDSAQVVTALGERSQEIGQIVATISGIAEQTNLLALNAAIEAARAGEMGRGFAVVADEVRKLAEQSQDATKQVTALIGGIQTDTNRAVSAMETGTRETQKGAQVVETAGQAFREIVLLVNQLSEQVNEISRAITQMNSDSQRIVGAAGDVEELSKKAAGEAQTVSAATQEQSASMEEIASSSQSLAHLAMDLREAVSRFRL